MISGLLIVAPFSIWAETHPEGIASVVGVIYGLAGYALYCAFAIGPVRLVAPIIGAYPVLSVTWAGINGQVASFDQWMAVFMIITGVGYVVGRSNSSGSEKDNRLSTVCWSLAAAVGFATAFAAGQAAASCGGEVTLLLPTRLTALGAVLALALILRQSPLPAPGVLPVLVLMGMLDALVLGSIIVAGGARRP